MVNGAESLSWWPAMVNNDGFLKKIGGNHGNGLHSIAVPDAIWQHVLPSDATHDATPFFPKQNAVLRTREAIASEGFFPSLSLFLSL